MAATSYSSFRPPLCILLAFVLLSSWLVTASAAYAGPGRKVGARSEVKDVGANEEMQDLGRFAVAEYNRQIKEHGNNGGEEGGRLLTFSRVVSAQKQVVSGIMYYLRIAAVGEDEDPEGLRRTFDAAVVVKAWLGTRTLVSFSQSDHLRGERFH